MAVFTQKRPLANQEPLDHGREAVAEYAAKYRRGQHEPRGSPTSPAAVLAMRLEPETR
jgi:hypothetical protein